MAHNIVLKNSQGNNVTYKNVSKVNLLDTNGNTVVFSEPKPTQTKTIIPTTSEQTATPDNGYELSEVKVGAIQTEEMTANENGEYTPSDGKYISKFTVNVASNGGSGADSSSKITDLSHFCSKMTYYAHTASYAPEQTLDRTANYVVLLDENFDASGATKTTSMCSGNTKLTVLPRLNAINATDMSYTFNGCTNLTEVKQLNTDKATNMSGIFASCKKLTTIPQINTSNATSMASMFRYCNGLTTIPQLNTSKVTSTNYMFSECTNLTSIPQLDFSSVTNASYMFDQCTNLSILPQLDFSSVTNATYMFNMCKSLQSPVSINFNSNYSSSADKMFYGCEKLTTIPQIDMSGITSANYMFGYCTGLENIDEFSLSNANNLNQTFYGCSNLKTIRFVNTSKFTSANGTFYNCTNLTTVEGLDMSNCSTTNIFQACTNLTNLTLKNIKKTLTIGSGTTYGHLLTVDSLVNTIKELWAYTSGTYKLTVGTANTEKLANVYVKLITATDEMIAADPNIESKMPCEVCESTDEGAMLITDYATSKGWTIS